MADAEAYAAYCGMRSKAIPQLPEELERPIARVLEIMKASGARKLDAHMKEQARLGVSTVSALGVWHSDFARAHWDPDRAAASGRAPSLNRALNRLRALIREG